MEQLASKIFQQNIKREQYFTSKSRLTNKRKQKMVNSHLRNNI